jgi:hypothetical protein
VVQNILALLLLFVVGEMILSTCVCVICAAVQDVVGEHAGANGPSRATGFSDRLRVPVLVGTALSFISSRLVGYRRFDDVGWLDSNSQIVSFAT